MSNGTLCTTASNSKAALGHQINDDDDDSFNNNPSVMSNFNKQSDQSSEDCLPRNVKTLRGSTILDHAYGPLYSIPQLIKCLQISVFQSGMDNLSNRIFRNAGDVPLWFDEFLAHALLINMHFFVVQVSFILHPASDAMHHIK
jgi:hypothetical protein